MTSRYLGRNRASKGAGRHGLGTLRSQEARKEGSMQVHGTEESIRPWRRMTRRLLTLLFAVTLIGGVAFAQDQGGSAVVSFQDDISTLDPQVGYDWQNWSIIKTIFDGLMDYVPGTTELTPHLAESYEVSEDGRTYTFKLREGVLFHNGREMVADDV